MNEDLNLAADQLESQALDLERAAGDLRRIAVELRTAKPAKPLPALISIRDAGRHYGLSEWAVRKLLADEVLREVGDRRLIITASLDALAGAA